MRRIYLFFMCSLAVCSWAQTLQGFVKTIGRPDKKGMALSGVSVRVKGGHNAVQSQQDGTFSMLMAGMKVGDAYSLQQVQKTGYELNEKGTIGRQYAFSDRVSLTIVMVSNTQLQADKQRIENNAYQVAEKNFKAKLSLIEKQKEEQTITLEQYRKELHDLQDKFERYQSLIDGVAEHYAHVDYDNLDEQEQEINLCIENGDLERADSLIHVLFDPIDVLKRNKNALSNIEQQIAEAKDIQAQANADMIAVLKRQEKDAEYLYQLYTIALARYDKEKARLYIETRAALDTTNIIWQCEAGEFICKYYAAYDEALSFYKTALHHAKKGHKEEVECLINIGDVFESKYEKQKAILYYNQALSVSASILGTESLTTAICYHKLSLTYGNGREFDKALQYEQLALSIFEKLFGEKNAEVATSYNHLGVIYNRQKKSDLALTYHKKALSIRESLFGNNNFDVAVSHYNIGMVYIYKKDYTQSLDYLKRSLNIRLKVLGDEHLLLINNYISIGQVYSYIKDYDKAITNYKNALHIGLSIYGNRHPQVARCYSEIGMLYSDSKNYPEAISNIKKSLEINSLIYGEDNVHVGLDYYNLGFQYFDSNDYVNAIDMFEKAVIILEKASNLSNIITIAKQKIDSARKMR